MRRNRRGSWITGIGLLLAPGLAHATVAPPPLPAGESGTPPAPEPAAPAGGTTAPAGGTTAPAGGTAAPAPGAEAAPAAGAEVSGSASGSIDVPAPAVDSEVPTVTEDAPASSGRRGRGKRGKADDADPNDPGNVEGRREPMMPMNYGAIGLFNTTLPDVGGRYTFRFRLHSDFFRKSDFMVAGDQHARVRGGVTIGFTPARFLELFFSVKSQANRNERNQTTGERQDATAVFALGDIDFGLKAAHRFKKQGIGLGAQLGLGLLSGSTRLATSNVNFWFDVLFGVDVRYLTKKHFPFRFTTNIGWILDNSLRTADFGAITDDTSREVSRFALGANHDRVRMRYALDFPVRVGKRRQVGIDPLLEWNWDISTGREPAFEQPLAAASPLKRSSQWLTLGLRVNPVSGLHFDAGVDIGMVSPNFEYGPPVPPWQVILGLGWSFDPNPVVREVEVEKADAAPPPVVLEGRIVGTVVDPNGAPIPEAKITFPGSAGNAIVTDPTGGFQSFRFPAGTIAIRVEVGGQVVHEATAEVKNGEDTQVTLQLAAPAAPPTGVVQGAFTDPAGAPVPCTVRIVGQGVDEPFNCTEGGLIALELFAGEYEATVTAPGFKPKAIKIGVPAKGTIDVKESLERDAPIATPNVSQSKNTIKLKQKIRYDGSSVSDKSFALLDELAAFINGHPELTQIEIGVHTDDRGDAQGRSSARAESVKNYLVSKGVVADRLVAKGHGAKNPVAVNMTESGRAKNNRTVITVKK